MSEISGRVLALDVGDRRIGMAISDPLRITAQALPTFQRQESVKADVAAIEELIIQMDVSEVVIGLPYNMNGSIGPQGEKVQDFLRRLQGCLQVPCYLVDERLTTMAADKLMQLDGVSRKKRSTKADMIAAQLILQSYLR